MLVTGDTSVMARVGLGYLSDLQFGILALVLDGDTTTRSDLPPFPLHPFHAGDRVTSNLCDEGCSALCKIPGKHVTTWNFSGHATNYICTTVIYLYQDSDLHF